MFLPGEKMLWRPIVSLFHVKLASMLPAVALNGTVCISGAEGDVSIQIALVPQF